jgi:hypothetical protein
MLHVLTVTALTLELELERLQPAALALPTAEFRVEHAPPPALDEYTLGLVWPTTCQW